MKRKYIFALRATIIGVCVILFILQSYKEIDKFFKGMTSVSTRTEEDHYLPHPDIVVCMKEGFKEGNYPRTLEEYINLTYSSDEIINNKVRISDAINITEIATFNQGRCVLINIPKHFSHSQWLHISIHKSSKVYVVGKGQELCIILYEYCREPPIVVELTGAHITAIRIRAKKKVQSAE